MNIELSVSLEEAESIIWNGVSEGDIMPNANKILDYLNKNDIRSGVISNMCWSGKSLKDRLNRLLPNNKSVVVERFPELSLFFKAYSLLDSEMICIFPYFCPYAESTREIREFFIKRCSLLYQEVLRNPVLLFLLSERKYSLWY